MKLTYMIFFIAVVILFVSCGEKKEEVAELKTQKEKASYIMGYDVGFNLKKGAYEIDLKTFNQGIEDGLTGKESKVSDSQKQSTMEMFEIERQKRVKRRLEEIGEINKVEGKKFLDENKEKEGISTFPTGVQMKILEQGTGKKPTRTDIVSIYFVGKFLDGTVFDQVTEENGPLEIPMDQLLPGQQQVLLEVQEGGHVLAFIPPNMAFGVYGGGELIPPHTTLVYEMELVEVKPQK